MSKRDHVTRRSFLRQAAGAAGAAVAAPYVLTSTALGSESLRPANDRITVCCIGVKNRGRSHMGGVLGSNDAELVAICDVDAKVRESALSKCRKGAKGFNDFRDVIARDDIDAVAIGTPDHTHAIISIAACEAGKDVFVEKPMTLTIQEGRRMVDAVRRYGRVLQVGSGRRSDGRTARSVELVRNGFIGKVHTCYVSVNNGRPGSSPDWNIEPVPDHFDYDLWLGPAKWTPYDPKRCHYNFRFVRDFSGGEMTNWGAHFFDVAQWGLGMDDSGPVEIKPLAGHRHETGIYDVFRGFKLEFKYADGVTMLCNVEKGIRWIGDEGWVDAGGGASSPSILKAPLGPEAIRIRRARGGHFGDWLYSIRNRQDPTAPVEAGHRSATVCHLANIALETGRTVHWDPVKEEFPGDEEAQRLTWRPYREPWKA